MSGEVGTLDEYFESLVPIQTIKQAHVPVICVGSEFWSGFIDWIK